MSLLRFLYAVRAPFARESVFASCDRGLIVLPPKMTAPINAPCVIVPSTIRYTPKNIAAT